MIVRPFEPGDEALQAEIYNEAGAALPHFKPATAAEVQRRTRAPDFEPGMRFFAEEGGQPVAYCLFHANGRVSYPWCRPGHESLAEALFAHVLDAMHRRGLARAFAAYREDWTAVCDFFTGHGFGRARDMVNFLLEVVDLPTIPARPGNALSALRREDVPAVFALGPEVLRVGSPAELEQHLFENEYFGPDAVVVLRSRDAGAVLAAGVLITNPAYADPTALDANMPCFRLGAFGTEKMQAKRVRGLFSFLARADSQLNQVAVGLLTQSALRLGDSDLGILAGQVPSDAPHLLQFYQRFFRRQGSFPVFERAL